MSPDGFGGFASERHYSEVRLLYYSDWQDARALARAVTEVIVIA
jgi:hypothetical protein